MQININKEKIKAKMTVTNQRKSVQDLMLAAEQIEQVITSSFSHSKFLINSTKTPKLTSLILMYLTARTKPGKQQELYGPVEGDQRTRSLKLHLHYQICKFVSRINQIGLQSRTKCFFVQ